MARLGEPVTGEVRIGTSGWQYEHWRGRFYPTRLAVERWLAHYATEFDTVELNASFYRLQPASTYDAWRRRLPPGFRMAVKASRYLTHVKRLRDPEQPLTRIWPRARMLGDRLGPMLYQLPPRWHRDLARLEEFAASVPRDQPQAVEFRHATWYHAEVDALLDRQALARCIHDMRGSDAPAVPVGPFVYLRFHGSGARYGGSYSGQRLAAWRIVSPHGRRPACRSGHTSTTTPAATPCATRSDCARWSCDAVLDRTTSDRSPASGTVLASARGRDRRRRPADHHCSGCLPLLR